MEDPAVALLPRPSDITKLSTDDPLFERAQEISNLIARRAYELFESSGFADGHDHENWLRAESEILLPAPVDITETENELIVRADVPGFSESDVEVRVEPKRLCIVGKRQQASERTEGKTIYSERRFSQLLRVLDLPEQVDPSSVRAVLGDGVLEVTMARIGAGRKTPPLTVRARVASA